MLISLALRKPLNWGAEMGVDRDALSMKTAPWDWTTSATKLKQGNQNIRPTDRDWARWTQEEEEEEEENKACRCKNLSKLIWMKTVSSELWFGKKANTAASKEACGWRAAFEWGKQSNELKKPNQLQSAKQKQSRQTYWSSSNRSMCHTYRCEYTQLIYIHRDKVIKGGRTIKNNV